jgi:hypothetical protein
MNERLHAYSVGTEAGHLYFVLAVGLGIAWFVLVIWYIKSESSAKEKGRSRWWAYLLLWPWLFDRNRKGHKQNDRAFTWREFIMATLLILLMLGAILVDKIFPVSSRVLVP